MDTKHCQGCLSPPKRPLSGPLKNHLQGNCVQDFSMGKIVGRRPPWQTRFFSHFYHFLFSCELFIFLVSHASRYTFHFFPKFKFVRYLVHIVNLLTSRGTLLVGQNLMWWMFLKPSFLYKSCACVCVCVYACLSLAILFFPSTLTPDTNCEQHWLLKFSVCVLTKEPIEALWEFFWLRSWLKSMVDLSRIMTWCPRIVGRRERESVVEGFAKKYSQSRRQ